MNDWQFKTFHKPVLLSGVKSMTPRWRHKADNLDFILVRLSLNGAHS